MSEGDEDDQMPSGPRTGSSGGARGRVAGDAETSAPKRPSASASHVTSVAQHRSLEAAAAVMSDRSGAVLLESTGPLAELNAAHRRGILDEARLQLVTRKAAGVVFEAHTVVQIQEAGERFGLNLTAKLASAANDQRADILVVVDQTRIELQLKTGSDRYLRASILARADGVVMVVPRDAQIPAGAEGVTSTLTLDDVDVPMPTRKELEAKARELLERRFTDEPPVATSDIAKRALRATLVDAVMAGVLDIAVQKLKHPERPIDWRQTARSVFRGTATSAATSFLAGANANASLVVAGRVVDGAAAFRSARVAAAAVPHALDVAYDVVKVVHGEMSGGEALRRASGHAGAALAELLAFRLLARLAARCGPVGILVMLVGGALASRVGTWLGEKAYDLVSYFIGSGPDAAERVLAVTKRLESAAQVLDRDMGKETKRRQALAAKRLCEEPRCGRKHHARGWCARHYQRWWRRQRRLDVRLYVSAKPRTKKGSSARARSAGPRRARV